MKYYDKCPTLRDRATFFLGGWRRYICSSAPARVLWSRLNIQWVTGSILSMHLGTFAIAALLLGGGAGTYMSTPHAQWLGVKAYAGEKETRDAEASNRHKFLKFNALYIQLLDDTGRGRAVIFNVSIEVPDSRRAEAVRANEPIEFDHPAWPTSII